MTTMRPLASSSCTRTGRTSMMRASTWRSFVMIPDWLPVKLIASPPSSRMAIDSSAMAMRSPAVSSMSSSRRSGLGETCLARPRRSSVVSPIADTTTTTSCPRRRVRMTRSATSLMRSTSATLEPPYFWTTIDIAGLQEVELQQRKVAAFLLTSFYPSFLQFCKSPLLQCHAEGRYDWRVVARPDLGSDRARSGSCGEGVAREHVVQPPADVSLPHVAPGCPPGEQTVVVRIERATDIDEAAAQDAIDDGTLLRQLTDRAGLALLRVHVAIRACDVHVAKHREQAPLGLVRRGERVHRPEEFHLGDKILAAVGNVDRGDRQGTDGCGDVDGGDAGFEVEGRVREGGPFGCKCLADVKPDAGIGSGAVPVAPVALHFTERRRHLIGCRLEFLQADHVRTLLRDPFLDLRLTRPDAVDVPGGELQ